MASSITTTSDFFKLFITISFFASILTTETSCQPTIFDLRPPRTTGSRICHPIGDPFGQVSSPESSPSFSWGHPLREPEKGCLLIATEKLDGVHIFERTVVLLVSPASPCPAGVILNRPSLMSIKEMKSTSFNIYDMFSDRPLFFEGPLKEGLFLVSSRRGGECGVFKEVVEGLYYGRKESVGCGAAMVKRNVVEAADFKFFDGYCGWETDQLKEEIEEGYWNVAACSLGVVEMSSSELWEEASGLFGKKKNLW
ncbi:hypothetical protein KSP40_PGU018360 [Platanthera guangdongensis]|uniref:Uncharacterized protein n=1 Tax=Platanthera guangdongensis TaxID=2320717 RepID=A0ABR2MTM9_9ASPA